MNPARLFQVNELLTLVSGIVVVAAYVWMKLKVPGYRLAHLNSPGPLLGIVDAYRTSGRSERETAVISATFRAALGIFLICGVISFAAGFVAAVRGPSKLIQF